MSQQDKLLAKILLGTSDSNIPFAQRSQLLRTLGFDERICGSHYIFSKEGIEEILNLQPKQGKAGVADSGYDSSIMRSLQPWVGAIHELPLLKVSYLNPATPKSLHPTKSNKFAP